MGLSIHPYVRRRHEDVLCEHNSSYNSSLFFLKLCRCFVHGLTMCMHIGHYRQIIFLLFLSFFWHLRCIEWNLCEHFSCYNFCLIFFETLHMFCSWSEGLRVVWILSSFFYYFFQLVNFGISEWILCEHNPSYKFSLIFLKLCTCFVFMV